MERMVGTRQRSIQGLVHTACVPAVAALLSLTGCDGDLSSGNHAPVAADASISVMEDTEYAGALPPGVDADGDAVAYARASSASHGQLRIDSDGKLLYQPNRNFSGSDSFKYRVSDGRGGSNAYLVGVTVTPVNDAPVAADMSIVLQEGVPPYSGGLQLASDNDGDAVTYGLATQAAHGEVQVSGNGSYSYRPVGGFTGPDSFGFVVSDGHGGSNTYAVTLFLNRPPVASDMTASVQEGGLLAGMLPAAVDANGDGVSYAHQAGPAHGSAQIQSNGRFTYAPGYLFHGSDSFTYRVSDSRGGSSIYTVNVNVTAVNHPPVLSGMPLATSIGNGVMRVDTAMQEVTDFALQPDGKMVFTGVATGLAQLRLDASGLRDTGFGTGAGIAQTSVSVGWNSSIAVALDGRIIAAGTGNVASAGTVHALVQRLNANGTPDSSFGGIRGIATSQIGSSSNAWDVVVQADGKVLVSGQSVTNSSGLAQHILVRYNADGSLDNTFSGDGVASSPASARISWLPGSLQMLPDGRILVAGTTTGSSYAPVILRFTADGSLDTSFGGGDGIAADPGAAAANRDGLRVLLQPDGRALLTACTATLDGNLDLYYGSCHVSRFNADGTIDAGFVGGNGIALATDFQEYGSIGVQLQADGRILVAGYDMLPGTWLSLARYNTNGTLDTGFGGGQGFTILPIHPYWARNLVGRGVGVLPDGRIVVAAAGLYGVPPLGIVRLLPDGSMDPQFGANPALLAGQAFSRTLPPGLFLDPDGDPLILTAKQAGGSPLPGWLQFDSGTQTFSGTPPVGAPDVSITVTATDPGGYSAYSSFTWSVL
jgi:uncharacterized delta-60 repeat protein